MPKQRDGRTIYVPVADSHLRNMIRPGSGIVGTADPDSGRIVIDYEGAIYGQSMSYEDKIFHAWGRHTHGEHGYPTVARAWVESEQLLEVGFLTIADPTDADVVAELEARYGDRVPREFLTNTHTQEFRVTKRDLARPKVHIDRQDIVDEWCAT